MTVWRAAVHGVLTHPDDQMEIRLEADRTYDDSDPYVEVLIKRFPSMFVTDNPVERATAEPGEKRRVKRT